MIDGFGLVKERSVTARAFGHCACERGVKGEPIPRLTGAEGPVGLVEWFLGEEKRPVEFGFKRLPHTPVASAKLRLEMVSILLDDMVEGNNGI
jgi:hypothetical protein